MKSTFAILLALGFTCSFIGAGYSQVITDSNESSNYLAVQIAVSSGQPAANYLSYAEGLAKTLSRLTPVQQAVIFGGGGTASGLTSGSGGDSNSEGASGAENDPLADLLATTDNGQFSESLLEDENETSPDYNNSNTGGSGSGGSTDGLGSDSGETDNSTSSDGSSSTDDNQTSGDDTDDDDSESGGHSNAFWDFLGSLLNAAKDWLTGGS